MIHITGVADGQHVYYELFDSSLHAEKKKIDSKKTICCLRDCGPDTNSSVKDCRRSIQKILPGIGRIVTWMKAPSVSLEENE